MYFTDSKKVVLSKKLNNVIYELAVRTVSDNVYVDENYTLTELIDDVKKAITSNALNLDELSDNFQEIMKDAPATFRSFKEVYDYIGSTPDPDKTIVELLAEKVDIEIGKGLSTNDLTDELLTRILNTYTKEEIDTKFSEFKDYIDSLIIVSDDNKIPEKVNEHGFWYQVITNDKLDAFGRG